VENAERLSKKYGIPIVCKDMDELVSHPEVDVVDVCVPTSVHDEAILKAFENRKHVICEKPLTGYFGEDLSNIEKVGEVDKSLMFAQVKEKIKKLESKLKDSGVKFMYAENFVYAPHVSKAKRLLAEAKAPILELRAEESHSGSHAAYSRKWRSAGGGSLLRMGSHPVGAVLHLKHLEEKTLYGEPIRISRGRDRLSHQNPKIPKRGKTLHSQRLV